MQAYIPMTRKFLTLKRSQSAMRGFTLIELMIAMVLSLFLIGGVILMYASTKAAYLDSSQMSRMQENIRFASDYMVRDLRNAGFRDQLTMAVIEQIAIRQKVVEVIDNDGDGIADVLVIRYAGRGHCQQEFNDYRVVENRYFFDAETGELRCSGGSFDDLGSPDADGSYLYLYDPEVVPDLADANGDALVGGLTGLAFSLTMADGTSKNPPANGSYVCSETPPVTPDERCVSIEIGLEFEALRDLDSAGQFERRFVELTSTIRNSSINLIYAPCTRLEQQAGKAAGDWCS